MTTEQFDAEDRWAGFAGIGAAIQLKRLGFDDFVILEREDDLGGTWYVNHYPGLAVDVPTTTYLLLRAEPELVAVVHARSGDQRYADDVADKYGVRKHMRSAPSWKVRGGTRTPTSGGWPWPTVRLSPRAT
jgi:cation diffusion facilitator CzcD-associated flavoprotein CzcO